MEAERPRFKTQHRKKKKASVAQGNGNPLQYSCLENPTERGAWQATVHGAARVGHDLANKPLPYIHTCTYFFSFPLKDKGQKERKKQKQRGWRFC